MAKIKTLGSAAANASDPKHSFVLDNIDIKGNGPPKMKIWIYAGLALAAYLVYKNKSLE